MTELHGELSAFKTIDEFEKITTLFLVGESKIMERVGDKLLIILSNAFNIALPALKFLELSQEKSNFFLTHSGMHCGEFIIKRGSLFGFALNKTPRI